MIRFFPNLLAGLRTVAALRWLAGFAFAASLIGIPAACRAQATPGGIVAADSSSLDALAHARKYVQEYFDKFSDVTCKESVTQFVLNQSGHTIYRENSAFDYQFQTTSTSGSLKFNEIRETRNPAYRDPARTLLVTTGFASLLLVAHPMYEASYVFEPAGSEMLDGTSYAKLHFSSVAGASSPATLRLRGKNYPLPMSGTLWVDSQSGAIVKLEAIVDNGLSDLGLAGMRSEVRYGLHTFRDPAESIWVAESAVIEVQTPRQHWRNQHRFSDYKRFNVNIQEKMGKLP
ncbi:MAG TPA: hypothetical protein VG272_08670 [Candidatus Acidoferrales bacterium]|nr:hypothetical protein [Candidatus Acidoferrales bacterium]